MIVLPDCLYRGQARERFVEVNLVALIGHARAAEHLLRDFAQHRFGERHQVLVVLIRLVELEHGELGVVPRGDALVAKVAVDLEHFLQPADHQALQVELRRDAQEKLHIERVVMRNERPRRRAAGNGLHHRRLDFEVAARHQEFANRLNRL